MNGSSPNFKAKESEPNTSDVLWRCLLYSFDDLQEDIFVRSKWAINGKAPNQLLKHQKSDLEILRGEGRTGTETGFPSSFLLVSFWVYCLTRVLYSSWIGLILEGVE
ncbi:hypothetical protein SLEP1_g49559 [Rubroshorea leprosula]|uniref:Uncharacterized protein n=1 Tax=Rubroshorea leprosula TaxID=152421 RepID=A0AAV5M0G4_9ROSI|nr:hypothetical protein SLEP1_g49559 [Rubroshorea leprosula]